MSICVCIISARALIKYYNIYIFNIIIVIFNLLFVDKANKNDRIELNYLNKNKEETINHIDKITVLF
jgi:hypothetical protein